MPTITPSSTTTTDRTTSAPILQAVGKAPERFVIYALGGGHGHAVRGALIAAELTRRGIACLLLVRSGCAPIARRLTPASIIRSVDEPDSPQHLERIVREAIDAHEASDMLVDTFPEGLLGELNTPIAVRRWAVLRVRRDALAPSFLGALERYHAVADVEPELDWLPHVHVARLSPLARRLEVSGEGVALIGGELDSFFTRLAQRLAQYVSVVRVTQWVERLPCVVIGSSGYNLTYELARAGVWHLALPRPRAFDDQRRRAAAVAELVESPEALERRALTLARQPCSRPRAGGGSERVVDWLLADHRQGAALHRW